MRTHRHRHRSQMHIDTRSVFGELIERESEKTKSVMMKGMKIKKGAHRQTKPHASKHRESKVEEGILKMGCFCLFLLLPVSCTRKTCLYINKKNDNHCSPSESSLSSSLSFSCSQTYTHTQTLVVLSTYPSSFSCCSSSPSFCPFALSTSRSHPSTYNHRIRF